jgi:hypothetical protein
VESPVHPRSDPLQDLADDELALISLLLIQGRSYDEAADLLGVEPTAARARAHSAISRLAGVPETADNSRLVDYLLREEPEAGQRKVASLLADDAEARADAARLAAALRPLARRPLEPLPESTVAPAAQRPPDYAEAAEPSPVSEPPVWAQAPVRHLRESRPVAPRLASRAMNAASHPTSPARRRLWMGAAFTALAVAAVVALAIAGSGGTHRPRRAPPNVRHLLLKAPAGAGRGLAAGAVVRQRGGLLLLLQGRRVAANRGDSYAVWLYNSPVDSRLLGFVSPNVGSAGTFSSGTMLPPDAVRFHTLLVTLETIPRPLRPGRTVLRGPLVLPPDR